MKTAKLNQGQEVNIHVQGIKFVIEPRIEKKYSLQSLLSRITKENIHSEVDFGAPTGRENIA
jgi:antitoxin MazE